MTVRSALVLFLASTGCSVLEIPPPPGAIAINQCDSEEQNPCGSGVCDDGVCVARGDGELSALILEVTPSSGVSSSGLPIFLHVNELEGGDLEVDPLVHVTGKASMPDEVFCSFEGSNSNIAVREGEDSTAPVTVSFTPREQALGIGVAPYAATVPIAEVEGTISAVAGGHRFVADLPLGHYDVYVQPRRPAMGELKPECQLLPVLVRNQLIAGDLEFKLPAPEIMELTVRVPAADGGLDGWKVELLDPISGRLLSIPKTLESPGTPTADSSATEYQVDIRYSTPLVFDDDDMLVMSPMEGQEVVRLTPPDGVVAPSFFYQRNGLAIFSETHVIDLTLPQLNGQPSSARPPTVWIHGQATRLEGGAPVESTLTFKATILDDVDIQSVSFETSVEADEQGFFDVEVLPGTYSVVGFPEPELELATARQTWKITLSAEDQFAKTIEFPERTAIDGTALVSGSNGAAYGASVRATVTPANILERTLGAVSTAPLALDDLVSRNGDFLLQADPGIYDFFIQPEARSRYPWYVRPAMRVPEMGRPLGEFHIPFPVIHKPKIVVKGTESVLPNALVRVYAYVTAAGKYSPTPEPTVVQVAEARADENGTCELLIPASLDARR